VCRCTDTAAPVGSNFGTSAGTCGVRCDQLIAAESLVLAPRRPFEIANRRDERRCGSGSRIHYRIIGRPRPHGGPAPDRPRPRGVLHGRNEGRSREAFAAATGARGVVSGDLSTIAGARTVADEVNKLGRFDAVIHNAGIGYREGRVEVEPGVPSVFAVNVLAPYILTALIERPKRLVYLSSGMHRGVHPRMDDLLWTKRPWSGSSAYAESKLCDVMLAFAVARRWKDVKSNALEPGW
jgi:hypothetical protein